MSVANISPVNLQKYWFFLDFNFILFWRLGTCFLIWRNETNSEKEFLNASYWLTLQGRPPRFLLKVQPSLIVLLNILQMSPVSANSVTVRSNVFQSLFEWVTQGGYKKTKLGNVCNIKYKKEEFNFMFHWFIRHFQKIISHFFFILTQMWRYNDVDIVPLNLVTSEAIHSPNWWVLGSLYNSEKKLILLLFSFLYLGLVLDVVLII